MVCITASGAKGTSTVDSHASTSNDPTKVKSIPAISPAPQRNGGSSSHRVPHQNHPHLPSPPL
eukprot:scaffold5919_cov121-Skeletonema_menzelii.AAC.1